MTPVLFDTTLVSRRSESWNDSDTAIIPQNRVRDERDARLNMQSIKNITDKTFAVPRYNWSSGTQYSAFDDNHIGYPLQPFYVMNSNQEVYVCLQQGKDAGWCDSELYHSTDR